MERERLRQTSLHALKALAGQSIGHGDFELAIQAALSAVALAPLSESAQRHLIDAYLHEGTPSQAIRQFVAYRSLLWSELHMVPSPSVEGLVTTLLSAEVTSW